MEELNTTQTILLCLLVSFVTSIGTGIITVSLLQEAPQTVTQTINRVVERTVETIVPQTVPGPTREVTTTVVVKEEDLVIDAIKKNSTSLVRIFENPTRGTPVLRSVGVVITKAGIILSDKRFISANKNYSAVFADGKTFPVVIAGTSQKSNVIFLTTTVPADTQATFVPAITNNSIDLQLGQTVIALGGKEKQAVAIGRLISINRGEGATLATTTAQVIQSIETDTPLRDATPGSILLNLNGELVGFENYGLDLGTETMYADINSIKSENPSFFQ